MAVPEYPEYKALYHYTRFFMRGYPKHLLFSVSFLIAFLVVSLGGQTRYDFLLGKWYRCREITVDRTAVNAASLPKSDTIADSGVCRIMEIAADSITIYSYDRGNSYGKFSYAYGSSGNTLTGSYFDRKGVDRGDTLQMAAKFETKNNELIVKEFASRGWTVIRERRSFYRKYNGDIPHSTWPRKVRSDTAAPESGASNALSR